MQKKFRIEQNLPDWNSWRSLGQRTDLSIGSHASLTQDWWVSVWRSERSEVRGRERLFQNLFNLFLFQRKIRNNFRHHLSEGTCEGKRKRREEHLRHQNWVFPTDHPKLSWLPFARVIEGFWFGHHTQGADSSSCLHLWITRWRERESEEGKESGVETNLCLKLKWTPSHPWNKFQFSHRGRARILLSLWDQRLKPTEDERGAKGHQQLTSNVPGTTFWTSSKTMTPPLPHFLRCSTTRRVNLLWTSGRPPILYASEVSENSPPGKTRYPTGLNLKMVRRWLGVMDAVWLTFEYSQFEPVELE